MPRFESSRCFLHGALRERNANCPHHLKVANPARLVPLPPIEGVRLAAGGAGAKSETLFARSPSGGPGAAPRRAFGDFRRETKVTRVPSMARPCSRGAPPRGECRGAAPLAYRATQGPPSLQSPRGGPQSPLYLYPETNKKLHPNVQPSNKKISPPRGKICAAQ